MERLTIHGTKEAKADVTIREILYKLAEYEDTGITPEQIREIDRLYTEKCRELADINKNYLTGMELANIAIGLKKLREYEDLEEQGKLLKLPCAVGDTYYRIENDGVNAPYIRKWKAHTIEFCVNVRDSIGKTVFLSQVEAETALKELQGQQS